MMHCWLTLAHYGGNMLSLGWWVAFYSLSFHMWRDVKMGGWVVRSWSDPACLDWLTNLLATRWSLLAKTRGGEGGGCVSCTSERERDVRGGGCLWVAIAC